MNRENITYEQFTRVIDHSLLQPQLTDSDVESGCLLARRYNVASVCVKPCHVAMAAALLEGSEVAVSTVIGFPHGTNTVETKLAEAGQALAEGATELDMVINYGRLRSGALDYVEGEVRALCDLAHSRHAKVKVIFENAWLSDHEKIAACRICDAAGADWVKTSTGFAPTGATIEDIRLMRTHVRPRVQIKAAHGIRTLAAALDMIDAGVTRIGATATSTMCDDFRKWKAGELQLPPGETAAGY